MGWLRVFPDAVRAVGDVIRGVATPMQAMVFALVVAAVVSLVALATAKWSKDKRYAVATSIALPLIFLLYGWLASHADSTTAPSIAAVSPHPTDTARATSSPAFAPTEQATLTPVQSSIPAPRPQTATTSPLSEPSRPASVAQVSLAPTPKKLHRNPKRRITSIFPFEGMGEDPETTAERARLFVRPLQALIADAPNGFELHRLGNRVPYKGSTGLIDFECKVEEDRQYETPPLDLNCSSLRLLDATTARAFANNVSALAAKQLGTERYDLKPDDWSTGWTFDQPEARVYIGVKNSIQGGSNVVIRVAPI